MSGINLNLPWFACQTYRGQEQAAAFHLRHRQHRWVFLPMSLYHKPGGARLWRPRFPGYILVQLDLDAPGWQRVNRAPGVFCRGGENALLPPHLERPVALPTGLVERLMSKPDDEHVLVEHYAANEVVRILCGPLTGILAAVERQDEERLRLLTPGGAAINNIRTSDVERA